ncbi:MAG: hypothetical protein E6095_05925 [Pseudescherichia vulneris]|nr:hypothetical protein [Pseudescherichia vulneris]
MSELGCNMMKKITIPLLTVCLLSASAAAAIHVESHPERNMDDVMSLGVVYINHNRAAQYDTVTEKEIQTLLSDDTQANP